MSQATYYADGDAIDYTPSGAKSAGDVVVISTRLVGVVVTDLIASQKGALQIEGIFKVAKVTGAISQGAPVYWDADANPVSGTAGSGAATATATNNAYMGVCTESALSGDTTVKVKLRGNSDVVGTGT